MARPNAGEDLLGTIIAVALFQGALTPPPASVPPFSFPATSEQARKITLAGESSFALVFDPPLSSPDWTLSLTFRPGSGGSVPGSFGVDAATASGGTVVLSSGFVGDVLWRAQTI